ncbi:MAG: hypothetical protein EPN45_04905, partial [Rhizobiaceae bacterium]
HESTGTTDEVRAQEIRFLKEKHYHEDLMAGPRLNFTFDDAVHVYLSAGKSSRFVESLRRHFGSTRVADITGVSVREAARTICPRAAYTTWNRQIVAPTKAIINFGADAGLCPPVKIKGFTKRDRDVRQPGSPPRRAVDRAYIDQFRAYCTDRRLATLMLFLFQTAARIGDAIELRWTDVDIDNRKAILRDMKNGEDGDAILTLELATELAQLRAAAADTDRVFGYMHRWSAYKPIRATCARARLPYLGTHQPGRHSFATEMIVKNGVDVATTAKIGRWKSKQLLMQNYVHGLEGHDVVDRIFGVTPTPSPSTSQDSRTSWH